MKIQLKSFFHYDLAEVFDRGQIQLEDDKATLRDLLNEVAQKSHGRVQVVDPESGEMDTDYFVLLNGHEVPAMPQGPGAELHDGDEVGIGMMHFWGGG
jgi:hypothetical protein